MVRCIYTLNIWDRLDTEGQQLLLIELQFHVEVLYSFH